MVHTKRGEGPGRYATANTASRNTPKSYKTTENDQKSLSVAKGNKTVNNLGRANNLEGLGIVIFNIFFCL